MKPHVALLLVAVLCSGCIATQRVAIPKDPGPPKSWGGYEPFSSQGNGCPDVSGQYLQIPGSFIVDRNGSRYFHENENAIYALIPLYLADDRISETDKQFDIAELYFQLSQPTPDSLEVTHYWTTQPKVEVSELSRLEGDFSCVDGFVEFPIQINYAQIEGMNLNGQSRKRMRRTVNGSLVIIHTHGPFKALTKPAAERFTHEFYRFFPLD